MRLIFFPTILKALLPTLTLAALSLGSATHAQKYIVRKPLEKDRFSLVIAAGAQNYIGDLLPRKYSWGAAYDLMPGIQLGGEYEISNSFRTRLAYYATQLSGNEGSSFRNLAPDEAWRKQRQLSFKSNIHEISASVYWDVLGFMQHRWEKRYLKHYITPYIGVGFAYAFMNPRLGDTSMAYQYAKSVGVGEMAYYDRDLVQKAPIKGAAEIPVTIGVRWQANKNSAVFLEASRHYFFTDYLDRVGNWTPEAGQNDGFISYAIGYRYTLPAFQK